MNLGERMRHGSMWIMTGSLGGRALDFAFGVVLARLLVPADFGMLVSVQIFTGIAGYVAGGGMGQALIQAKEIDESDYRVVFTLQLGICLLIYTFFYFLAPWLAVWFDNPLYTDLMRVSALTFFTRPLINVARARLARDMRYKVIAIISFTTSVLSGIASIYMATLGMGPWALIIGGLVGAALSTAIFLATTRWRPGFQFNRETAGRLGSYGFKFSVIDILVYARNQTSNLIISRMLGPSMVGLFNKADSLTTVLAHRTVAGPVHQTVFRGMSINQENLDKTRYLYLRAITLVTVYTLPFLVGMWWVAGPFIIFVYGDQWSGAIEPLRILVFTGIFRCINVTSGTPIAALNRLGTEIRIQVEAWAVITAGILIGIQWGITGVAWALIPGIAYLSFRLTGLARQCVNASVPDFLRALKPALLLNTLLFLALAMMSALLSISGVEHPGLYLLLMTVCGAACYACLLMFLPISELETEAQRWKARLRLT